MALQMRHTQISTILFKFSYNLYFVSHIKFHNKINPPLKNRPGQLMGEPAVDGAPVATSGVVQGRVLFRAGVGRVIVDRSMVMVVVALLRLLLSAHRHDNTEVVVFARTRVQLRPLAQRLAPLLPLREPRVRVQHDAHPEVAQLVPQLPALVAHGRTLRSPQRQPGVGEELFGD